MNACSSTLPVSVSEKTYKRFLYGTHRTLTPQETVARIWPQTKAFGITRVANVTGLDYIGVPVVMVVRPNSRGVAVAQGKGVDLDAAKASGLMESIECFHAEHIEAPVRFETLRDLQCSARVVQVAGLPQQPTSTFHDNLPILWIEGSDIVAGESVWVPYNVVHTNYTLPAPPGSGSFAENSSGLASGNHILEAISHAICELIERDAVTLKYLDFFVRNESTGRSECRIDLDSIQHAECRRILDLFIRASIDVEVLDFTSDVGVPVFECSIRERPGSRFGSLYPTAGWGCHPASDVALLRALTEAAQSRLTMISGSRDDAVRSIYHEYGSRYAIQRNSAKPLLSDKLCKRSFVDIPTVSCLFLEDEIAHLTRLLNSVGAKEIVVVNLTKSAFGIPVVRAVIPGLEGAGPGTGHGRRYRPGRRARRLIEALCSEGQGKQ